MVHPEIIRTRETVYLDDEPTIIYHTTVETAVSEKPVIFLHGWGLTPHSYQRVCDEIALHGHNVLAPALPGFGGSAPLHHAQHDTYGRTVERIADILHQLDLPEPLQFVGHSFGAGIAVGIAAQHPEMAERLILVSPMGGSEASVTTWVKLLGGIRHEINHNPLERMFDVVPSLLKNPVAFAVSGIAAKHTNLTDSLHTVMQTGIPITMVMANVDKIAPVGQMRHVPGIECVEVDGTHGWILHHPDLCGDIVEDALTH